MPSTAPLKSKYYVCDNATCVHYQLLRRVDPIDLGEDLFTIRPVFCACRDVELRRVSFDPAFEIPEGLSMHLVPLVELPHMGRIDSDWIQGAPQGYLPEDPPMGTLKVPAQTAAAIIAGMDVGDTFFIGDYHVTITGKQTKADQDPPRFTVVGNDDEAPVVSA